FECGERESKVRDGFVAATLSLGDDAQVLLHHSRQTAVAEAVREQRGLAVPAFGTKQVAAKLRDRAVTVQRMRASRLVYDRVRDGEALRVQIGRGAMVAAIAQHRAFPAEHVGERVT